MKSARTQATKFITLVIFVLMPVFLNSPALTETRKFDKPSKFCASLETGVEDYEKERALCAAILDFVNARFLEAEKKLAPLVEAQFPQAQYLQGMVLKQSSNEPETISRSQWMVRTAAVRGVVEAKASHALLLTVALVTAKSSKRLESLFYDQAFIFVKGVKETYPEVAHRVHTRLYYYSINNDDVADLPPHFVRDATEAGIATAMITLSQAILAGKIPDIAKRNNVSWHRKATEQGNLIAVKWMAERIFKVSNTLEGRKQMRFVAQALNWFSLAKILGASSAKNEIELILARFPSANLPSAKRWAEKWLKLHYAKTHTEIGRASMWCQDNKIPPNQCMPTAIADHFVCFVRLPKKYFDNIFQASKAYNNCRYTRLAEIEKIGRH